MSKTVRNLNYDTNNLNFIETPSSQKAPISIINRRGLSFLASDGLSRFYAALPAQRGFQQFEYDGETYLDVPGIDGNCVLFAVSLCSFISGDPFRYSELYDLFYDDLADGEKADGDWRDTDQAITDNVHQEMVRSLLEYFPGLDFRRGYPTLVDSVDYILDHGILPKDPISVRMVKINDKLYHCLVKLPKRFVDKAVVMPRQWCSEKVLEEFDAHKGFKDFISKYRKVTGISSMQVEQSEFVSYILWRDRTYWFVISQGDVVVNILSGRGMPHSKHIGIRYVGPISEGALREAICDESGPEPVLLGHYEPVRFQAIKKNDIKEKDSKSEEKSDRKKGEEAKSGEASKYYRYTSAGIHVSTVFKFGKHGEQYVRDQHPEDVGKGSFVQPYTHPFPRFVVDKLTVSACRLLRSGDIYEVAAKYNRTNLMLERSSFEHSYFPNRATLGDYDREYKEHYSWSGNKLDERVLHGGISVPHNLLGVDCYYYGGVPEFFEANVKAHKTVAYIIIQEVKDRAGKYYYYDYEGHVLVTGKPGKLMVDNRPKGNDKVYKHPRVNLPYGFLLVKRNGVDYRVIERVAIGSGVNVILVKLAPDSPLEPEALALTLRDGFVPRRLADIPLDLQLDRDILPPIYEGSVRGAISAYLTMKGNLDAFIKPGGITNCLTYVNAVTRLGLELSEDFRHLATDVALEITRHQQEHLDTFSLDIFVYLERLIVWMYAELRNSPSFSVIRDCFTRESRVGAIKDVIHQALSVWICCLLALMVIFGLVFITSSISMVMMIGTIYPLLTDFYNCLFKSECMALAIEFPILLLVSLYGITVHHCFRRCIETGIDLLILALLIVTTFVCNLLFGASFIPRVGGARQQLKAEYFSGMTKVVPISDSRFKTLCDAPVAKMVNMIKPQFMWGGKDIVIKQFVEILDTRPLRRVRDTVFNVLPASLFWLGPSIPSADRLYGAWGFFLRHVTPKVLPDPKFDPDLSKHIRTSGLLSEYRQAIDHLDVSDFHSYLHTSVDASKQGAYIGGYNKFKARPIIPLDLQITTKPDEKQYKDINKAMVDFMQGLITEDELLDMFKARNIFNPTEILKAILGWFAHNLQRATKKVKTFEGCFCQGWTTEDLEYWLVRAWNAVDNPTGMAYDGGFHDAHQHDRYLDSTDNYLIRKLGRSLCAKMGLNQYETDEIIKKVTSLEVPVRMFSDLSLDGLPLFGGNRIVIFKARLTQTVFSGHPTRTTWGNTNRQLVLVHKIAKDLGMRWKKDIWPFQGGDDFYCVINSLWVDRFRAELLKYYSEKEGVTHGWGQLMKDYKLLGNKVDFLSKVGFVNESYALTFRKYDRIIWTGLVTTSVGRSMTMGDYYHSVRKMVDVCYSNIRGVTETLSWRDGYYGHLEGRSDKKEKVFELVKDTRHAYISDADLYETGEMDKALRVQSCQGNPESLVV